MNDKYGKVNIQRNLKVGRRRTEILGGERERERERERYN